MVKTGGSRLHVPPPLWRMWVPLGISDSCHPQRVLPPAWGWTWREGGWDWAQERLPVRAGMTLHIWSGASVPGPAQREATFRPECPPVCCCCCCSSQWRSAPCEGNPHPDTTNSPHNTMNGRAQHVGKRSTISSRQHNTPHHKNSSQNQCTTQNKTSYTINTQKQIQEKYTTKHNTGENRINTQYTDRTAKHNHNTEHTPKQTIHKIQHYTTHTIQHNTQPNRCTKPQKSITLPEDHHKSSHMKMHQ
mgnify:CR=1 FL=1